MFEGSTKFLQIFLLHTTIGLVEIGLNTAKVIKEGFFPPKIKQ